MINPIIHKKYPSSHDHKVPKRVNLTIADMEAYLLFLLVYRYVDLILKFSPESMGQVLFLSALRYWTPTENQVKFWRQAIVLYGKEVRRFLL